MNKLIFNGKEVSLGDTIEIPTSFEGFNVRVILNEVAVSTLLKANVLKEVKAPSISYEDVVKKVANKMGVGTLAAHRLLCAIKEASDIAYFKYVLKICSAILHHKYKVPFTKTDTVWCISTEDGSLMCTKTSKHSNAWFRCNAVFHSKEDAEASLKLVDGIYKDIFNEQKNS